MLVDWDLAIKIWAIVGPLIAAAGSAIWSRRIQLQDRTHETDRDAIAYRRLSDERESEHERALDTEIYKELKAAVANFVAATNEFVQNKSFELTNPTPERVAVTNTTYERWNYNCQLVVLLGDSELSELATTLWNATLSVPCNYKNVPEYYPATLDTYKQAKRDFVTKARLYMAEQRRA